MLLLGVLVFVFYVFNRPPVLFSQVARRRGCGRERRRRPTPRWRRSSPPHRGAARRRLQRWPARATPEIAATLAAARQALIDSEAAVQAVRGRATDLVRETRGDRTFTDINYIIPTFILTQLPIGLIGVLIVAILMAATDTIAAELNSLSTATVIDFYKRRVQAGRTRPALPDRLEGRHRVVGVVRVRGGGLGGGARIPDRGRQPVRFVLLWLDPRRVHSRGRLSARDRRRRILRADRRDGIGGVGGVVHPHRLSLAQRHRCGRRRDRRPARSASSGGSRRRTRRASGRCQPNARLK